MSRPYPQITVDRSLLESIVNRLAGVQGPAAGIIIDLKGVLGDGPTPVELLREAVVTWPQLDPPATVIVNGIECEEEAEQISGADMVDWFADWRDRVKTALGIT